MLKVVVKILNLDVPVCFGYGYFRFVCVSRRPQGKNQSTEITRENRDIITSERQKWRGRNYCISESYCNCVGYHHAYNIIYVLNKRIQIYQFYRHDHVCRGQLITVSFPNIVNCLRNKARHVRFVM